MTTLLFVAGCNPQPAAENAADPKPSAACDTEAVAALGRQLASASTLEASGHVWPGLKKACAEGIPTPLAQFFESLEGPNASAVKDEASTTMAAYTEPSCEGFEAILKDTAKLPNEARAEAIYDRCDFQRYGLIDEAQAERGSVPGPVLFAFHQWLLDEGFDARTIRPITQALIARQVLGPAVHGLPADFQLPVAPGLPLDRSPTLTVSAEGIMFDQHEAVAFEDAFSIAEAERDWGLVPALHDYLAPEAERQARVTEHIGAQGGGTLMVMADGRTPFVTLADVLYTAEQAKFSHVSLVSAGTDSRLSMTIVQPHALQRPLGALGGLDLELGLPTGPGPDLPILSVHLTATAIALSSPGKNNTRGRHPVTALEAISERATQLLESYPAADTVLVSATPEVPLNRVLQAIAAARGPQCSPAGEGCILDIAQITRAPTNALGPATASPDDGTGYSQSPRLTNTDVPKVALVKPKIEGGLDEEIIRRVVRRHTAKVRACYQKGLAKNPELSGRLAIGFTIGPTGKVTEAEVASTTLEDEDVGTCIAKAAKAWVFPKPTDGGDVQVTYPFQLRPA